MKLRGRFESVELIVPAAYSATKLNFPDIPELRSDSDKDALIFSISTYSSGSVPNTFNNNVMATFAQLQNMFLTLYCLGSETLFNLSLLKFLNIQNSAAGYFNAREYFECAPLRVDWTKSYVSFAVVGTAETAQYALQFDFGYEWMPPGSYATWLQKQNNQWQMGIIQ